ncbi:cx9C motif-containing protein 4 [Pectinophora gossypiella]|uniref:cx9C motif-containing protein 4 n=1 Tax=Pectinophora gossypiella TaxID=13191 RepID=UPI00214E8139|nr:cx9C motif-containing protein 4 [Pectinophora gossypiella]
MSKDPCKRFACDIQKCLMENNFQEIRCDKVFEAMRQCCMKHKPVSLVCDGYDVRAPRQFSPATDTPQKIWKIVVAVKH